MKAIGIDPLLLGVIMVVNTSVGMITPPMAVNLFVASGIVKEYGVKMEQISLSIVSFLLIEIIDIIIISNFTFISLLPVQLLRG